MRAAIYTVFINIGLTIALVTPLWMAGVEAAHAGIALATGLAGIANTALLWRYLRKAGLYQPLPGWRRFATQLALGCVLMVLAVLAIRHVAGDWNAMRFSGRLLALARRCWRCPGLRPGAACAGLRPARCARAERELSRLALGGGRYTLRHEQAVRDARAMRSATGQRGCIGAFDGLHRGHRRGQPRAGARRALGSCGCNEFRTVAAREYFANGQRATRLSLPRPSRGLARHGRRVGGCCVSTSG